MKKFIKKSMKISNRVEIGGIQKSTLIDYPGKMACTVFLIGCNFRCPFCYSSELVLPEKIKLQPKISAKDFFDFLKERKGLLDGVVICGGEPTMNEDLPDFIKKIKKLGYLIKLDTNGSNPEMLRELIEGGMRTLAKRDSLSSLTSLPLRGNSLIDYVAMDIKAPLGVKIQKSKTEPLFMEAKAKKRISFPSPSKSQKYDVAAKVKVDLDKIKKSIEIIKNSGLGYEFRTTVVPTIHIKEDIIEIARELSPAQKYYLQNFKPEKTIDPKFERIKPYSKNFLREIKKEISRFFDICEVRD